MFKVVESHYVRKTEKHQFLPKELCLAEMHSLYTEFCEEKGYEKENFDFYKKFRRRFRLKFMKPKKDECNTCTAFNTKIEVTDAEAAEQQQHLADKEYTRIFREDKKSEASLDEKMVTSAFDLEQVLLAPFGATGAFYYSRLLKNHNLTAAAINNMKTHCFIWNEHEANIGSCEIATSLYKFFEAKAEEGAKVVYLFCDCCGGQNRNRFLILMLLEALKQFNFDSIELMYLVAGHSQNENDNSLPVIEQYTCAQHIFTTNGWEAAIQNSFKKNSCSTTVLMYDDIIKLKSSQVFPEFSHVYQDKCFPEVGKDEKKKKLMWSQIKHLKFVANQADYIFFKYDHADEFRKCLFRQEQHGTRAEKNISRALYSEILGICSQKKEDLMKLCSKGLIPKNHHSFYEALKVNNGTDDVKTAEMQDEEEDVASNGE